MMILLTYAIVLLLAILPIYFGSFSSVRHVIELTEERLEMEPMTEGDAMKIPIFASCVLFGAYLLFSFVSANIINVLGTTFFVVYGVYAMRGFLQSSPLLRKAFVDSSKNAKSSWTMSIPSMAGWIKYQIRTFDLICTLFSVMAAIVYTKTKHWAFNNIYCELFAFTAIEVMSIDSFVAAAYFLIGLFVYDIFWVFGTNVMIKVATTLDLPIKLAIPRLAYSADGFLVGKFMLLGAGDIVVPGSCIALCLVFDYYMHEERFGKEKRSKSNSNNTYSFEKPYFHACFKAYIFALGLTMLMMHLVKRPQPALLYLSPACIFSVIKTAWERNELEQVKTFKVEMALNRKKQTMNKVNHVKENSKNEMKVSNTPSSQDTSVKSPESKSTPRRKTPGMTVK